MKNNKLSRLIKYEFKNLLGSWYIPMLGVVFPIFLALVIGNQVISEVKSVSNLIDPKEVSTGISLGFLQVIPMASIFMGHSALYSQELENKILLRLKLFSFKQREILISKMLSQLGFLLLAFIIYFIATYVGLGWEVYSLAGTLKFFALVLIECAILFTMAHAIANIFKKFGVTYAITMVLYFFMLFFSGMMGLSVDKFPNQIRWISKLLPFTYFANEDILKLWKNTSYNYIPLIQSLIFMGSISVLLLVLGNFLNKNRKQNVKTH